MGEPIEMQDQARSNLASFTDVVRWPATDFFQNGNQEYSPYP